MEGRIFLNGKTVSPKSTADAFIFDLQRFAYAWSLNSSHAEWGEDSPIASLTAKSGNIWSLTGSSGTGVSIDATAGDSSSAYSLVAGSIRSNSAYKIFDASSATIPFYFKLASDNPITSIAGGSGGNSIDASQSTVTGVVFKGGNGADIFYYKGGAHSIESFGTGTDSIELEGSFTPVLDGSKLTSIGGGFVLKFDDKNSLTFTNFASGDGASSIVSVYGSEGNPYQYTSTAISLAGSADNKSKVTLGAGYKESIFDGTDFSLISAAAVGSNVTETVFSIKGSNTSNYIVGSDYKLTSIMGGSGADTLVAGKEGAYFDSITGNDLIIGVNDTEKTDTFIYNSGNVSIENYNYDKDIFSLSGEDLTVPTKIGSDSIKYGSSNYIISLGSATDSVLTFKSTNTFALKTGESIYTYTPGTVALSSAAAKGITLGGEHYSSTTFNGASEANSKFVTIDASAAMKKIKVTGNDEANYMVASSLYGGTLLGGEKNDTLVAGSVGAYLNGQDGADSLVGGAGNDTFVYTGGKDSIRNYKDGDIVNFSASDFTLTAASVTAESITTEPSDYFNIKLKFDDTNELVFESIASNAAISVKSGKNNTYVYKKDSVTWNDKSITLTSAWNTPDFNRAASDHASLTTIDASQVGDSLGTATGISIVGNDLNNYIIGGSKVESVSNSLYGGKGNDTLVGNASSLDVFMYSEGKDVIVGFDDKDKVSIGSDVLGNIKSAKLSSKSLSFTIDKTNTLTFQPADSTEVPSIVSLNGGGYLTKDGIVSHTIDGSIESLNLFSKAKGKIDLLNDALYSGASITSVNASAADKQGVTLVGSSLGSNKTGTFIFAANNKKHDGFEYHGGKVSISGFESGKDKLNLGNNTISGFSISDSNEDVIISLNGSSSDVISLASAQGYELQIHQDAINKGNSYSKIAFNQSGVIYDKAKPTSATLWAGLENNSFTAANDIGKGIKKITTNASLSAATSITAGDNVNTVIDASKANVAVSLYGGAKNDKLTGSKDNADTFIYTFAGSKASGNKAGKDIINSFVTGDNADMISLGADATASVLADAKISVSKNSIKFKFDSKNVLTVNSDSAIKGEKIKINGTEYSYDKNAIVNDRNVSLTSAFSGTYKIAGDVNKVDGGNVTKNLTFKATSKTGNETVYGGTGKTTYKLGGGTDSLIGGSGKDVFVYTKNDEGTAHIADFDFKNDSFKIANGTLKKIESLAGGHVQFDMKKGKSIDDPAVANFEIGSYANYTNGKKEENDVSDADNVLIHANNTYYWFAKDNVTEPVTVDGVGGTATIAHKGDLITWDKKVTRSDIGNNTAVIELNYSTNLVRAGVATAVSKTNTPPKSTT